MVSTISNNLSNIVTLGATILTVVIAYLTEHHDSTSKQLDIIQATVKQQLDLKTDKLNALEERINELQEKNAELKKAYEIKIRSLKNEILFLREKNAELKQKLKKVRSK